MTRWCKYCEERIPSFQDCPCRAPALTAAECRDRIVELLRGRGWVPILELSRLLAKELGLTANLGRRDLAKLVKDGRLCKRLSETRTNSWNGPNREYSVDAVADPKLWWVQRQTNEGWSRVLNSAHQDRTYALGWYDSERVRDTSTVWRLVWSSEGLAGPTHTVLQSHGRVDGQATRERGGPHGWCLVCGQGAVQLKGEVVEGDEVGAGTCAACGAEHVVEDGRTRLVERSHT